MEAATRRRVDRARDIPLQNDPRSPLLDPWVGNWHRGQQRLGIRVQREIVQLVAVCDLDDLAHVHDGDAVADVADDGKIMGDEEIGQVELRLELLEQVDHLGLNGHVERADRLVADNELRFQRERSGNSDALTLAAAELVRVAVRKVRVQPDDAEHLPDFLFFLLASHDVVDLQWLGDDGSDRHAGVQRRKRILEDHLHVAAQMAQLFGIELGDVAPLEPHLARCWLIDLEHSAAGRGFPAAALTDQPERLSLPDAKADVIDGMHVSDDAVEDQTASNGEIHLQIPDRNQSVLGYLSGWLLDLHFGHGASSSLRKRLPSKQRSGPRLLVPAAGSLHCSSQRRRRTGPGRGTCRRW
jgi:hypothetical protein